MSLIKNIMSQATDSVINNPKTAIAVPVATAALGKVTMLAEIQSWLTVISMGLGVVVSLVILWHKVMQVRIIHIEHREALKRVAK